MDLNYIIFRVLLYTFPSVYETAVNIGIIRTQCIKDLKKIHKRGSKQDVLT